MSTTIRASFGPLTGDLEVFHAAMKRLGFPEYLESPSRRTEPRDVLIELRTVSERLARLVEAVEAWHLTSLNEAGIGFYVIACMSRDGEKEYAGDGFVFVPFSNILAIHDLSDKWVNLSMQAKLDRELDRKGKENA